MAVISLEKVAPPEIEEVPEFQEEFAKLSGTYNSLLGDFKVFKAALWAKLPGCPNGTVTISGLGGGIASPVYKVRDFRCKCIKSKGNRSGMRIIYTYNQEENKITFLEIYHKNQKSNHDKERIIKYLSST